MSIEMFRNVVEQVGLLIDAVGVLVVVVGIVMAAIRLLTQPSAPLGKYKQFRQDLGRGILLGLEFLVAADIIRTVAVTPTLESVLVLGLIVPNKKGQFTSSNGICSLYMCFVTV